VDGDRHPGHQVETEEEPHFEVEPSAPQKQQRRGQGFRGQDDPLADQERAGDPRHEVTDHRAAADDRPLKCGAVGPIPAAHPDLRIRGQEVGRDDRELDAAHGPSGGLGAIPHGGQHEQRDHQGQMVVVDLAVRHRQDRPVGEAKGYGVAREPGQAACRGGEARHDHGREQRRHQDGPGRRKVQDPCEENRLVRRIGVGVVEDPSGEQHHV
jgi:hypothetical protein